MLLLPLLKLQKPSLPYFPCSIRTTLSRRCGMRMSKIDCSGNNKTVRSNQRKASIAQLANWQSNLVILHLLAQETDRQTEGRVLVALLLTCFSSSLTTEMPTSESCHLVWFIMPVGRDQGQVRVPERLVSSLLNLYRSVQGKRVKWAPLSICWALVSS